MKDPETSAATSDIGGRWWRREGGGLEVLRVALPLVVSSMSLVLLTFIDRMFLLWWSETSFAASFPAALLWWVLVSMPWGVCLYVQTFVAQYHGSQQPQMIGRVVWQGAWLAVLATPLVVVGWWVAPLVFAWADHGSAVIAEEQTYFNWLLVGAPGLLLSAAFSGFYAGRGQTRIVMFIDAGAAMANIILDYWWIFGGFGLPAGGIAGAAIATSVVSWLKAALYLALIIRSRHRREYATGEWRIQFRLMGRLVYFGGPGAAQILLEVAGFTVFIFLLGSIGELELSATNLAFNISSLAFHPVLGLSMATSILVGQRLGANQIDLAVRTTWTAAILAGGYMGLISLIYLAWPDLVLFGFFANKTTADQEAIHAMAVVLLRFVAAYNLFDAMNLVFSFAVKGAGDTHFVMYVSAAMGLVLAVATWSLRVLWNAGVYECWVLITVWVWMLGVIYFARFLQGHWKSMRVVDM